MTSELGALGVSFVAGDFDGDGALDIAAAHYDTSTVSVVLGTGRGSFHPPSGYAAGDGSYGVATGDFDGDGALDLATADYTAGTASILLGAGDGTFGSPSSVAAGAGAIALPTGDFDGDG
jgi:hypothetical protein